MTQLNCNWIANSSCTSHALNLQANVLPCLYSQLTGPNSVDCVNIQAAVQAFGPPRQQ